MPPFILNSTFMQKVIENKHKVGMNLGEPLKEIWHITTTPNL